MNLDRPTHPLLVSIVGPSEHCTADFELRTGSPSSPVPPSRRGEYCEGLTACAADPDGEHDDGGGGDDDDDDDADVGQSPEECFSGSLRTGSLRSALGVLLRVVLGPLGSLLGPLGSLLGPSGPHRVTLGASLGLL